MSASPRRIALKPYLDAVKEHCLRFSRDELVETLLSMALEVPAAGRIAFLEKIRALTPGSTPTTAPGTETFEESLLDRIGALTEEIDERIERIEDGEFYEDPASWEYDSYDEGPQLIATEQCEELAELFIETDGFFLAGRLESAFRLYHALFELVDAHHDILSYMPQETFDIREERARYCRAGYELCTPKDRVRFMLDGMEIDASMDTFQLDPSSERHPMLADVVDARPGDLPGFAEFLKAWEKALIRGTGDRAAVLKLEVAERLRGIPGVAALARAWKGTQPRGYLYWIDRLREREAWGEMIEASREALGLLPVGLFRERAAEGLTQAASRTGDKGLVLLGKRERFRSAPKIRNLLDLLAEARAQDSRSRELDGALAAIEPGIARKSQYHVLYLKMLLMAGRLDKAFAMAKGEKSVGWSTGMAGVLFASLLWALSGGAENAPLINGLLQQYARDPDIYDEDLDTESGRTILGEILPGIYSAAISKSEADVYRAWAEKIGRARIDTIVSGLFRGAYERAARVLGALAEYHILSGETERARSLLHEYYQVKFRKHRAFRGEVKTVVSESPLLEKLGTF